MKITHGVPFTFITLVQIWDINTPKLLTYKGAPAFFKTQVIELLLFLQKEFAAFFFHFET